MTEHTHSNVAAWPTPTLDDLRRAKEAIDALGPAPKFTGILIVESNLPRFEGGKSIHWELNERGDVLISDALWAAIERERRT